MIPFPIGFQDRITSVFGEQGSLWLSELPDIVLRCEKRWSLQVGPPFPNLSYNFVAPGVTEDGREIVLKVGVPNPELDSEIEALRQYDGRGAVALLEADKALGAMVLRRLQPGIMLSALADDDAATMIAASVMQRLWRPLPAGHSFPTVVQRANGLVRLRQRFSGDTGPLPAKLVDKAEALFSDLLASSPPPVLLHGDLHHENILSAGDGWLAIDPKGLTGDPVYETAALLVNPIPDFLNMPQPLTLFRRVDLLSDHLGFDRQRILAWGFAKSVLAAWWCVEDNLDCWQYFIACAKLMEP